MDTLFTLEPLDNFKTVSQEVLNRLCENSGNHTTINANGVSEAIQEMKQLIINCNFDLDEAAAVIKTKSWDQDKIEYFLNMLQGKRIDLLYSLLTHSNSSHGDSLTNFYWVLKLVLGTSELRSPRYPLVQLILHTETSHGNKGQKIYELNKEALKKFINILENVE